MDEMKSIQNVIPAPQVVEICRACSSECKDYKSLYKQGLIFGELTTLSALLKYCTTLDCNETEENCYLPKYICNACIQDLARAYLFKKKVLETQQILQAQLKDEQPSFESIHTEDDTEQKRFLPIYKGTPEKSLQSVDGVGVEVGVRVEEVVEGGEAVTPLSNDQQSSSNANLGPATPHSVQKSPKKVIHYVEANHLQELAEVAQLRREWEQYFDGPEHYVTLSVVDDNEPPEAAVETLNASSNPHHTAEVEIYRQNDDGPQTHIQQQEEENIHMKVENGDVEQATLPDSIFVANRNVEVFQRAEEGEVIEYVMHEENVETSRDFHGQHIQDIQEDDATAYTNTTVISRSSSAEVLVMDEGAEVVEVVGNEEDHAMLNAGQVVEEEMHELEELDEEELEGETEILEVEDSEEYELHIDECNEEEEYEVYMPDEGIIETLDSQEHEFENVEADAEHQQTSESETSGQATRSNRLRRTETDKKNRIPNPAYKCKTCGKQLSTPGSFRYHMQLHSDLTPFLCTWCGASFKTRNAYDGHVSIHDPNNPNTCKVCGRAYRQPSSLKIHMLSHTGEKPFTCDMCGKKLTQKSGYKKHMLTHTGEKPHVCDLCGKQFRYSSNMLAHRRCHTGVKPHSCPHCDKRFITSEQAKRHVQVHSCPKNFSCEDCGRVFKRNKSLLAHKRDKCGKEDRRRRKRLDVQERGTQHAADVAATQTSSSAPDNEEVVQELLLEEVVVNNGVELVTLNSSSTAGQEQTTKVNKSNIVEIY